MSEQFFWHLTRASGIVAWLLLTASVLWGIFLATDAFPAHRRPAWLLDLHRWLGGLAVGFVATHLGALVADSYVDFGLLDLIVPFASDWKPLPVALGVVALWGLVAVEVTSLARKRLSKRTWRAVHLSSYATFWLTSLHATFAGTDASSPLYVATSVTTLLAVVVAVTYRILRGRGAPRRPARPAPAPVPVTTRK